MVLCFHVVASVWWLLSFLLVGLVGLVFVGL